MGLLLLRIFAAVFILTTLVALMSAIALRGRRAEEKPQGLMLLWAAEFEDRETRAIQRRFRLCVKLSLLSCTFVVLSIVLAMMEG